MKQKHHYTSLTSYICTYTLLQLMSQVIPLLSHLPYPYFKHFEPVIPRSPNWEVYAESSSRNLVEEKII